MGVAEELERLAELHRAGHLNDAEYEAAKRAVLTPSAQSSRSDVPEREREASGVEESDSALGRICLAMALPSALSALAIVLPWEKYRHLYGSGTHNGLEMGDGVFILGLLALVAVAAVTAWRARLRPTQTVIGWITSAGGVVVALMTWRQWLEFVDRKNRSNEFDGWGIGLPTLSVAAGISVVVSVLIAKRLLALRGWPRPLTQ